MSDTTSCQSSRAGSSKTEESDTIYERSVDEDEDEDEDEEYGDYDEDEEEGADFSDISTLGWSCADGGGDPWASLSSFRHLGASGEKQAALLASAETHVRDEVFSGSTRKVPNRVAAAQARAVNASALNTAASARLLVKDSDSKRSYEQQMVSLSIDERKVVAALKESWIRSGRPPFPNTWYLKFARCSPGRPFTLKTAYKSMKAYDQRFMNLSIRNMEEQLLQKVIFPIQGLKSISGHNSKSFALIE